MVFEPSKSVKLTEDDKYLARTLDPLSEDDYQRAQALVPVLNDLGRTLNDAKISAEDGVSVVCTLLMSFASQSEDHAQLVAFAATSLVKALEQKDDQPNE